MFERYLSDYSLGKIVDESYKKGIPFLREGHGCFIDFYA